MRTFVGDPGSVTTDTAGNVLVGVQYQIWTAQTGGTQITALQALDGTPLPGVVTSTASGLAFRVDNDDLGVVWARSPQGGRWRLVANESYAQVGAAIGYATDAVEQAGIAAADATEARTLAESATLSAIEAHLKADQAIVASPVAIAVNAKSPQFGATGDGIADDTLPVQSALDFLTGISGTVMLTDGTYKLTSQITIPQGVRLQGNGRVKLTIGDHPAIMLSSGSTVENVEIIGNLAAGAQATSQLQRGIRGSGSWPSAPVVDVTVKGCTFRNLHYMAVSVANGDRVSVTGNRFINCGYAGAVFTCSHNVDFSENYVYGTGVLPTFDVNSYAATTTINSGTISASNPKPRNTTMHRNVIENQAWEALDTHAGDGVSVIGNIIRDSEMGIAITIKEGVTGGTPDRCVVADNIIIRGAYPLAAARGGITVNGETGNPTTAHITGNMVIGYGTAHTHPAQASPYSAAVAVNRINSCVITGNTIQDSLGAAIRLRSTEAGVIANNMIQGVWRDNADATRLSAAINLQAAGTAAPIVVTGNVLTVGPFGRTNTNERALYDLDAGNSPVSAWGNQWGAAQSSGVLNQPAMGRALDAGGSGRLPGATPNGVPGTTPGNTLMVDYPAGESHWNATGGTGAGWPANGLLISYNYASRGNQILYADGGAIYTRNVNLSTGAWRAWKTVAA